MNQSHAQFIGAFDNVRIAETSGGGDDRFDAGGSGNFNTVFKGEETVAGHDRTFQFFAALVFFFEFDDGLFNGSDSVLFAGSDGEGLSVFDDDHAVGTDGEVDMPREQQVDFLLFSGGDFRFDCAAAGVFAAGSDQVFNGAEIGCQRGGNDQRAVCKNLEGVVFRTCFAGIARQFGNISALEDTDLYKYLPARIYIRVQEIHKP